MADSPSHGKSRPSPQPGRGPIAARAGSRRRRLFILALALGALIALAVFTPSGDELLARGEEVYRRVARWMNDHPLLGAALYLLAATLGKVTPFPGGLILLTAGGLLLGPVVGPILGALGGALAALVVGYLGSRLFREPLLRLLGDRAGGLRAAVQRDGASWLLAARLFPVIPAWLVNLVPVAVPIRLRVVFAVTFVGLLPIAFILGGIGAGLGALADIGDEPLAALSSPRNIALLCGLALAALSPIAWRAWKRRRQGPSRDQNRPGDRAQG